MRFKITCDYNKDNSNNNSNCYHYYFIQNIYYFRINFHCSSLLHSSFHSTCFKYGSAKGVILMSNRI